MKWLFAQASAMKRRVQAGLELAHDQAGQRQGRDPPHQYLHAKNINLESDDAARTSVYVLFLK